MCTSMCSLPIKLMKNMCHKVVTIFECVALFISVYMYLRRICMFVLARLKCTALKSEKRKDERNGRERKEVRKGGRKERVVCTV